MNRFFFAGIALACFACAASAQSFDAASYYPLKVGSKFAYADVANHENFVLQVTEKVSANGMQAVKLQRLADTDFDVISSDASGIKVHSRHFNGMFSPFTPAVLFAPAAAVLNQPCVTIPNFKNPATGNNTVWTSKIDAVEDVTVPAGKFPRCLRLDLSIRDEKLGTVLARIQMWLAPGVGMVKRQGQFFGVFYVQQLTSYTLAP